MEGREAASFWSSPTGLLRRLVEMVVAEAVEGGMADGRADELFKELTENIEKQDGKPCACNSCDNTVSMDDVAECFLDRVRVLLAQCPHEIE